MADQRNTVSQTWDKPFQAPDSIPGAADVVIVGGGIVGVCTAWFLAKQGIKAALCEKGHIAGEQSGRNWGWVRQTVRDSRELPMMIESMRIWAGLADEIGEDVGFERGGCMIMARNQKELGKVAEWMTVARDFELDTQIVEGDELENLFRGATAHWAGALYSASDARAEPHKATPAICRAAAREGAAILTSCAVRGIETSGGHVSAVVTEHGTIRTSRVLCAAGAWTSMFCRSLGISVPQLKVKGTVVRLGKCDNVLNANISDDELGIRRRQDGGYTAANGFLLHHSIALSTIRYGIKFLPALMLEFNKLRLSIGSDLIDEVRTPRKWPLDRASPFEKQRVLNPLPSQRVIRNTRRAIDRLMPQLAATEIVEAWAGIVETSPDMVPVMCESETIGGFFIATGFSGHGFGIGPGAGKAAADMLTNTDSSIDLSEFQLKRFFDGSPIRPQSSV
jgi:glycine/D-amino acid oxidase-like deaminating enzyme